MMHHVHPSKLTSLGIRTRAYTTAPNPAYTTGMLPPRTTRRLTPQQPHPPLPPSTNLRMHFLRSSAIRRGDPSGSYTRGRLPSAAKSIEAAPPLVSSTDSLAGSLLQMEEKRVSVASQVHLAVGEGAGATKMSGCGSRSQPRTRMTISWISMTVTPSERQPFLVAISMAGPALAPACLRIVPAYQISPLHHTDNVTPSLRRPASG
jgi:hypothetical protein